MPVRILVWMIVQKLMQMPVRIHYNASSNACWKASNVSLNVS
jgi:hypothetical protein